MSDVVKILKDNQNKTFISRVISVLFVFTIFQKNKEHNDKQLLFDHQNKFNLLHIKIVIENSGDI